MSIVDQHGKPFRPNIFSTLSARVLAGAAESILRQAQPSDWEERRKIDQLRESCGAPAQPATIVFRRPRPCYAPAPAVDPAKWAEDCDIYSGRRPEGSAPTESV